MQLPALSFFEPDLDLLAEAEGRVAVFLPETGKLDRMARRVNRVGLSKSLASLFSAFFFTSAAVAFNAVAVANGSCLRAKSDRLRSTAR